MRALTTLFLLFFTVSTLSACANTVRGAGEDIQKAGETLQKCC